VQRQSGIDRRFYQAGVLAIPVASTSRNWTTHWTTH